MSQTIISLANAMYSGHVDSQQSQHDGDDRLDAARALLGVSPSSVADNDPLFCGRSVPAKQQASAAAHQDPSKQPPQFETFTTRNRSDSAGLEALAFLATKEQASIAMTQKPHHAAVLSDEDDSETMPPPPPRSVVTTSRRRRSVSNPEGMEKWAPRDRSRLHFVLPASILEEELAEANAAMLARDEVKSGGASCLTEVPESDEKDEEEDDEPVADEEDIDQDELLRRARSRLLEDLSQGSLNGDKGELTLPHSLDKYKEVYNKNGRIGIYTPAERAAIISRFQSKRGRRVWNKKIRYNCRKNLADRRMRVKGRFVKRSTEAQAKSVPSIPETREVKFVITPDSSTSEECTKDEQMPDVNDPDAGFCPTDDQPFRRIRRHTIT